MLGGQLGQHHQIEGSFASGGAGSAGEINREQTQQHEHRTEQREEEKLDGGVFLFRAAPDANQEIHRDQRDFPEHVEQEKVERNKKTQHAGFQEKEPEEILLGAFVDAIGGDNGDQAEKRGQQHQRYRKPVNPQVVVDIESGNPAHLLNKLHVMGAAVEAGKKSQGHREGGGGG